MAATTFTQTTPAEASLTPARWWTPTARRLAFLAATVVFVAAAFVRRDVALGLLVLGALFTLLERIRPVVAGPPAIRRRGAATDACHFVVDEVLAAAGLIAGLAVLLPVVDLLIPDGVPRWIAAQPKLAVWGVSLLAAEVAGYWGHRMTHQVPLLWRFHRVHHSSPAMDWLAPNRRHPIDMTIARLSVAVPLLAMGIAVPTVVTHFAIKRFQGLFVHANVKVRFGLLEWFVATPHFHHWHHSAAPGTWDYNYAGQLPLVDWVFGTLHRPADWPDDYGCDGTVPDEGYVAQLLAPWAADRDHTPPDAPAAARRPG
jgi:sterol desaturase/sphingolipid hydroxylase (fatty acid hydroxylase superfamily)